MGESRLTHIPRGLKKHSFTSEKKRATVVKITSQGKDFKGDETTVHVRREGNRITADVFDNSIKDNDKAHITSESFPYTDVGAKQVTEFLKGEGISKTLSL